MTAIRPRLIIVGDDSNVASAIPELSDSGLVILRAATLCEARAICRTERGDLIVLAANALPGSDALDAELRDRFERINAAGADLTTFDSNVVSGLNMAERLKLLEEKIVRSVHDELHFDNFEVRLIDRKTHQLELVIAENLSPLRIGESLFAESEGNGISGRVAATGESYLCNDVSADPLYREGLDDARSSLTVPLKLNDRVIGVMNIESFGDQGFTEIDRTLAETYGRSIALSMHMLDLLVVERYTTNEQVTRNVISELDAPLDEIREAAEALRDEGSGTATTGSEQDPVQRIVEAAAGLRSRVEACTSGPRTILDAEHELRRLRRDPLLAGKRALVADDEDGIRDALGDILRQIGLHVTLCSNGLDTINEITTAATSGAMFDIVISDIKMPDRNGYEVFRAAKEVDPELPVILMTGFGYDPHHSIVRASQEGMRSILFKPFRTAQLIEAVTKAIASPSTGN